MDSQNQTISVRPSFWRAFLPFWITSIISLVVFGVAYHRRNAPLTLLQLQVLVDGHEPEEGFALSLDGKEADIRRPVSLGSKVIVISSPYTEPVQLKHFVWYGLNPLGVVELKRSRVNVALDVQPKPDQIELHGQLGNFTNSANGFGELPSGRYDATFRFGELTDVQPIRLVRDGPSPMHLIAGVGSLELAAEPAEAAFRLTSKSGDRAWDGAFPGGIPRLPKGDYLLTAARGEYRREMAITIRPNETNRLVVKFVYGGLEVVSEPPDASVMLSGNTLGRTPLTLSNLIPGQYRVELTKPGYDAESSEVRIAEGGSPKVSFRLVNTRYRESLAAARFALQNNRQREALQGLEAALAEQPQDATVLELLPATRLAALHELAREQATQHQFADAIQALDAADKLVPNNPTTQALRASFTEQKRQQDQQTAETLGKQALQDARDAVAGQRISQAATRLADAKRLAPALADIPEVERLVQQGKARQETEAVEARRMELIAGRRKELADAFTRIQAGDQTPDAFIFGSWKTGKTVQQVRSGIENLLKQEKSSLKLSDVYEPNDHLLTFKLGSLLPLIGTGTYIRIATATVMPGETEILARICTYQLGDQGPIPDADPAHQRRRQDELKSDLLKAVDGDLKPTTAP